MEVPEHRSRCRSAAVPRRAPATNVICIVTAAQAGVNSQLPVLRSLPEDLAVVGRSQTARETRSAFPGTASAGSVSSFAAPGDVPGQGEGGVPAASESKSSGCFVAASKRRAFRQVGHVLQAQTLGDFPQALPAGREEAAQETAPAQFLEPRLPVLRAAADPVENLGHFTREDCLPLPPGLPADGSPARPDPEPSHLQGGGELPAGRGGVTFTVIHCAAVGWPDGEPRGTPGFRPIVPSPLLVRRVD